MGKLELGRLAAIAFYIVAYMLAYIAVGSFDAAYDAFVLSDEIALHNAERSLSSMYDFAVVLGLASLWLFEIRSWLGGSALGVVTALAAGGFHVVGHVGTLLLPALFAGFAGGLALLTLGGRRPGACALLGVEVCLATVQVLFIIVN